MRVVLDTNIMVSALLSPFSPAARIMTHWKKGTLNFHAEITLSPAMPSAA